MNDGRSTTQPTGTDIKIPDQRDMEPKYSHPMESNYLYDHGDGILVGIAYPRRIKHDCPLDLPEMTEIKKIQDIKHSRRGISIVCTLKGQNRTYMFEHFDIWLFENADESILAYFAEFQEKKMQRIRLGRLGPLIACAEKMRSCEGVKSMPWANTSSHSSLSIN